MAVESLIVTNTDGTTDLTFNLVSSNGYSRRYAKSDNVASDRQYIDTDHKLSPAGQAGSDVHTLTLRREAIDNDTQKLFVTKVSVQITVPKTDLVSATNIANHLSNVMSLFNKNFMAGFVQGETPAGDYNVTGPFNPARA